MRTPAGRQSARRSRALLAGCALIATIGLAVSPSLAEETVEAPTEDDVRIGWEPSLSIGFGLHSQNLDGTVATDLPVDSGGTLPIGRGESNDMLAQNFSPSIGLDAPPFYEDGLRPRLFIHAGGQLPLSDEFIARRYTASFAQGDPTGLADNCRGPNPRLCFVRSKNRLKLTGGWFAGLGVDIRLPVRILDRRNFHLRTSIEYYGQAWESFTTLDRLSTTNAFGMPLVDVADKIKGRSDEKIVHGFGPRVQLAIHLADWGEFRMDAFLGGQFYWLLTDNDVRYTGSSPDGNLVATTKADPYVAQGGAGIRVTWKGWE